MSTIENKIQLRDRHNYCESLLVREVFSSVGRAYNLSREQLLVTSQQGIGAEARAAIMYLLRTESDLLLKQIGLLLNLTNHSSVINGVQKAQAKRQRDPDFDQFIEYTRKMIAFSEFFTTFPTLTPL